MKANKNRLRTHPRFDKCRTICRIVIPAFWFVSGVSAWLIAFAYNTTFNSEYRSDNLIALICSAIVGTSVIASFLIPKTIRRVHLFYMLLGTSFISFLLSALVLVFFHFIYPSIKLEQIVFLSTLTAIWMAKLTTDTKNITAGKSLHELGYRKNNNEIVMTTKAYKTIEETPDSVAQLFKEYWIYSVYLLTILYNAAITPSFKLWATSSIKIHAMTLFASIFFLMLLKRITQGFYLRVYLPWRLEKKTGKKVLFPPNT